MSLQDFNIAGNIEKDDNIDRDTGTNIMDENQKREVATDQGQVYEMSEE